MRDVAEIVRRPTSYLAETGIPQLAGGLVFFFLGSSIVIQRGLPATFLAQELPHWIALCCAGAILWGQQALKRRMVFPRAGYAEPLPQPAGRPVLIGSLAMVAVIGIVGLMWQTRMPHLTSVLIEPGFAVAFAILCLGSGIQQKSPVMMWFGVYFVCLAPVLWWMPVSNYERGGWLQVGAGVPVAVAGAVQLKRFLKANPKPVETVNE